MMFLNDFVVGGFDEFTPICHCYFFVFLFFQWFFLWLSVLKEHLPSGSNSSKKA